MRQTALRLGTIALAFLALGACATPSRSPEPPPAAAEHTEARCMPLRAAAMAAAAHVPALDQMEGYKDHDAAALLVLFNALEPRTDFAADTILVLTGEEAPIAVMIGADGACARWQVVIPADLYAALRRQLGMPT